MSDASSSAIVFAGIADKNPSLYRRLRVALGDPAAWYQLGNRRVALVRDIERERVQSVALADVVQSPPDFAAAGPLDADRETATAQALARSLLAEGIRSVSADRTFPYIYVHHLQAAGIEVRYDRDLGVIDRRVKSDQELEWLAAAQLVTEAVMESICSLIAHCNAATDGVLHHDGAPLTSQRVRSLAGDQFAKHGYSMSHGAIIATAPQSADCHHAGDGPLWTGMPIIVDLFPRNETSRYNGDCTRTVVHGQPSDEVVRMHAAVCDAKRAAELELRVGNTAHQVHQAVLKTMTAHGYKISRGQTTDEPTVQHGTGHGIGLEVHEPILLDDGGGELLLNEVYTVEPGLYGRRDGGVRVEDMLVVQSGEPRNLNRLHQGLCWK